MHRQREILPAHKSVHHHRMVKTGGKRIYKRNARQYRRHTRKIGISLFDLREFIFKTGIIPSIPINTGTMVWYRVNIPETLQDFCAKAGRRPVVIQEATGINALVVNNSTLKIKQELRLIGIITAYGQLRILREASGQDKRQGKRLTG